MKVCRRDVFEVKVGNGIDVHGVVVLSPEEVNSEENKFLGVMISDSPYFDPDNDFSFPLTDEMFTSPLKYKNSRVRLFIINFYINQSISIGRRLNEMRIEPFKKMLVELNSKVFGIEVKIEDGKR